MEVQDTKEVINCSFCNKPAAIIVEEYYQTNYTDFGEVLLVCKDCGHKEVVKNIEDRIIEMPVRGNS